jgi:hypothetical protein
MGAGGDKHLIGRRHDGILLPWLISRRTKDRNWHAACACDQHGFPRVVQARDREANGDDHIMDSHDLSRRTLLTQGGGMMALLLGSPWFAHAFPRREGEPTLSPRGARGRRVPPAP